MIRMALLALVLTLALGTAAPPLGSLLKLVKANAGNSYDPDGATATGDAGGNADPNGATATGDVGNNADPNG
jgi:hypothetical protein